VRTAAVAALGRWQSGHLPYYGRPMGRNHSWCGLGLLLAQYKRLYFQREPVAGAAGAAAAAAAEPLPAAEIDYGVSPDMLLALASSGTPLPISFASLADLQLRRALLAAIAGVRHTNGRTPDCVLAFLAAVLRGYDADASGNAAVYDDAPLLATLVLATAQAVADADGAARLLRARANGVPAEAQPADEAVQLALTAVAALRETLALEVISLRHASLRHAGISGIGTSLMGTASAADTGSSMRTHAPCSVAGGPATSVAACLTALALLQARGFAEADVLATMRNHVGPVHPLLGTRVPPHVRVAAFVGLARCLLASGPARADGGTAWYAQARALLQLVAGGATR
jgi:hypothetical protein